MIFGSIPAPSPTHIRPFRSCSQTSLCSVCSVVPSQKPAVLHQVHVGCCSFQAVEVMYQVQMHSACINKNTVQKISIDSLLKLSILVHMNSQEEETLLKAHGLGELCSTVRPSWPPSPCAGKHWLAAYFHRKQHDEAAKTSCKSAQSCKGKLCTEVTKTLVIINKDQETTSTARPAPTEK